MPLTDVTIKFLEMTAPGDRRPKRAPLAGVTVTRVILDTCSLDHPKAFDCYVARGFRLYRTDVVQKNIPK